MTKTELLHRNALSFHVISIQAHDRQSERWRTRYYSTMTLTLIIFCNQTDCLGASCAIRTSEMTLEVDKTNRLCLQMPHHLCISWPPSPAPTPPNHYSVLGMTTWTHSQVPWQWQWTVCHHYFRSPFISLDSPPRPNAPRPRFCSGEGKRIKK
jgi:hypothetical protein